MQSKWTCYTLRHLIKDALGRILYKPGQQCLDDGQPSFNTIWSNFFEALFSLNRPTGPIRSSSRDVSCMYVCMYVCLSVCLSVPFRIYALMYMFAPTSWSRMSKIFRDSESLGKSAGKKWSQNWTFFFGKWSKIAVQKKVIFFTAPGVKIGCINRTIFVLEHSILTLGALLT